MDQSLSEPPAPRHPPAAARGWRAVWRPDRWTALAAMMAIAHFASFPAHTHPIATDIRYYVYYSAELARGRVLYRDTFDPKGPFAPVVGAALHRLAEAVGADPLLAIRHGFLALASVGAVGAFLLHRHLAGGRAAPAFVGLAAYLGTSLLALLPAIGNICKLGMQTACVIAALFVAQRAWLLAGIAAGIAVLDWQIGAVAVAATLAASLCTERHVRAAAAARVLAGVALALAPVVAYFAWHHALGDALRATGVAAFAQHTSGWAKRGVTAEAARRWALVSSACAGHRWLFAAGLAGIPVYAGSLTRSRRDPTRAAPMLAIGLCQLAILALSAWELQGYGDLFALLHSLAFLGGFALIALGDAALARTDAATRKPRRTLAVFLALALVAARPWQPRGEAALATLATPRGVTLVEQRALAREVADRLGGRHAAYLGPSEIPFFLGVSNPVPFTIWHASAHAFYARPGEASVDTLSRMLHDAGVELVVTDHGVPPARDGVFVFQETIGNPSRCAVDVWHVP